MVQPDFIKDRMEALKGNYPLFRGMQDYHVFTILCLKYFFFNEGISFDPEMVQGLLTDGANDGGIDAVFNDPNSEGNDMIIVQSKYYEKTPLRSEDVVGELYKINETIHAIDACRVSDYSEQVVSAYRNAKGQMEDSGVIRIVFFTSYAAKSPKEREKMEQGAGPLFKNYDLEMNFRSDIQSQIETIDSGKLFVDFDTLEVDRPDNILHYEESAIVNISAQSLQELQNRHRNGLLGMNLRYYVRQKAVDDGIQQTIQKEPENFWYKNNGIIILCEKYELDGKELNLFGFSIVNGGQTTNRIGRMDIVKDFYLQCKVVKRKGTLPLERDRFAHSIAEATNAQKPIKKADLKSNTPEQMQLRERLQTQKVYYITKKGDKAPKQYSESYQVATLERVGKISLAGVLQMPGSARSNSQRMYQEEYYERIFGPEAKEGIIADLLRISYYYDGFLKTQIQDRGYDKRTVLPMLKNGKTFQLAAIGFLCKLYNKVFAYDTVAGIVTNTEELKEILCRTDGMTRLIGNRLPDERETFYEIFSIIGDEVLGYCFSDALDAAEDKQSTLAPSDYLKSDYNYYRDVLKRIWRVYKKNKSLADAIGKICSPGNG